MGLSEYWLGGQSLVSGRIMMLAARFLMARYIDS
jgi:hypothetical protein